MKTTTKWILVIVIGLVVVVALVAFGLLVVNRWGGAGWMMGGRAEQFWDGGRTMPWGGLPGREMPMHPFWRVPIDRFGGYYPLRMIAGSLIWLGLLTLIVLGVISLVRGLTRPQQPANVSGSAASAPAVSVSDLLPSSVASSASRSATYCANI